MREREIESNLKERSWESDRDVETEATINHTIIHHQLQLKLNHSTTPLLASNTKPTMNSFSDISNTFRSVPRHTKCVACAGAIAPNEIFFCARLSAKLKNLENFFLIFRLSLLQRRAPRRA
jgi:hypothetical protein